MIFCSPYASKCWKSPCCLELFLTIVLLECDYINRHGLFIFYPVLFFPQYFAEYVSVAEVTRWSNMQIIQLPRTSANDLPCLRNLILFPSGTNTKSKEVKRKEDLSLKPRSHVGTNPVTSSRFTVSPANDPHLVWFKQHHGNRLRCNPLWFDHNYQPFAQRLFFYWMRQLKDSRSRSWTHSGFYQRQDFVWQG